MKKQVIFWVLNFIILSNINLYSQKINPFHRVKISDSIYVKLEKSYFETTGFENVNAGRNVWNLINKRDFVLKDGLYLFRGQGPHYPSRIFIYDNNSVYMFRNNHLEDILTEYVRFIEKLKISEINKIKYLKIICNYLQEELGQTYGAEITKE